MASHPRISRDAVVMAVDSILSWIRARSRKKQNLDDDFLYLVLTLKKIPHRGRTLSFPVPLPNPNFLKINNNNKKKNPVPLKDCGGSTLLHFRGGTCSGIKVGSASQSRDEIVENVMAAVEGAVGHVPRKWANVRSFHIKAAESLAIPIYQSVPESGLKIEGFGKRKDGDDKQEGGLVEDRKSKRNKLEDKEAKENKRRKVRHGID